MLEAVVTWLTDTIFRLGYPGITLLMAIESSFFPFPSEVVLPPAGYLAAQGRMNVWLALGAGLSGSLIGAFINYYLAVFLGRPLLHKYHRFLLMREASLDRAEQFFRRHGEISTFVGRLIPVIRQLISLPAGVARMRLDRFALLTFIGWEVGRHAEVVPGLDALIGDPDVQRYSSIAALALVPLIVVVVGVYIYRQRKRSGAGDTGAAEPS